MSCGWPETVWIKLFLDQDTVVGDRNTCTGCAGGWEGYLQRGDKESRAAEGEGLDLNEPAWWVK
jgi:hypothetical protein